MSLLFSHRSRSPGNYPKYRDSSKDGDASWGARVGAVALVEAEFLGSY